MKAMRMRRQICGRLRVRALLAATALGSVVAVGGPEIAAAQFLCVDNTGSTQGATAGYANDLACGKNAAANGAPGPQGNATAVGNAARAAANQATALGDTAFALGDNSTAIGAQAIAGGGAGISGTTAVGAGANANGLSATALGYHSWANGDATVAVGNASASAIGAVAVGQVAAASAAYATAFGYQARALNEMDVALGAWSWTVPTVDVGGVTLGGVAYTFAGETSIGAVSVGGLRTGGTVETRQIQYVSAGQLTAASTDAVNGSQLFATNRAVETLATSVNQLGSVADLAVEYDWSDANGDGVVDPGEVDFTSVTLNQGGAPTKVTNVAAGDVSATSADAINGSQLYAVQTQVDQNATDITNIYTTVDALSQDALLWDSSVSAFSAAHGGVTANKITNVAAGDVSATSSDAVNGSQLYAVQTQIDQNTTDITNIDGRVTTIEGDVTNLTNNIANGSIGLVQQTGGAPGSGAITVGAGTGGTTVNFAGTDGTRVLSGVSAGAITSTSTEAVNGSQLWQVVQSVTASDAPIMGNNTSGLAQPTATGDDGLAVGWGATSSGTNSVAIGAGSTDGGLANVVSLGAAGVERKLVNLAPGTLSATSTDGVNGSQLYATNVRVASLETNAVRYDTDAAGNVTNNVTLRGNGNGPVAIHNVAAGTADTDAVNVGQLNAMGEAGRDYTDTQVRRLDNRIGSVQEEARGGISAAMAASAIRYDDRPGKGSLGLGLGGFKDMTAIAAGVGYTSEEGRWRSNAALSYAPGADALTWSAGVSWTFN